MKTLLIISGGIEAADAARRAREMGLHVVVSDIDPNAPGFAYANDCLIADVYGPEETAQAALFLASDESSAITGQSIVVDSGVHMYG